MTKEKWRSLAGCVLTALAVMSGFSPETLASDEAPRLVIEPGGHTALIHKVLFTRDGCYVVSAGDDYGVRVWELKTGTLVRTIRGQVGGGQEGMKGWSHV